MNRTLLSFTLAGLVPAALLTGAGLPAPQADTEISGIYPHLAMFNDDGECGTGAVVPWADRLWVISYAPHKPQGSADKLYEITPDRQQIIRPESIGGTPANRMIHRESNQLFIGPYAIDALRNVRTIPHSRMYGRLTGNARHLTAPAGKIYSATMEEGIYEVDVKTLAVTELWADEQLKNGRHAELPGYHGKGLYAGQGRLIYANNGEHKIDYLKLDLPSGCLAEWDAKADKWSIVRRAQFTEITGPGGIYGSKHPATDPVWSMGWDSRSLILMLLDGGHWRAYRLPKPSHTYDGTHGWHTEWPRIRDIGETDLLMTMHGSFWRFPRTFSAKNSAGIAPRSTYLKVIGDFCRWNDRLVFGCDDTAKAAFSNTHKSKSGLASPGQSQSNLWFVKPQLLDQLGTPLGRGAVWVNDTVKAGEPSEPFLFAGYERRGVHLAHDAATPVTFTFEVDVHGNDEWTQLRDVEVRGYAWVEFPAEQKGAWIRVRVNRDCAKATAYFQYANAGRNFTGGDIFSGIAKTGDQNITGALLHARGGNKRSLAVAADAGYYELDGGLKLRRIDDAKAAELMKKQAAITPHVLTQDNASVIYVDDNDKRWRLPQGELGDERVDREIATERDLFNCAGTFYEYPSGISGGFGRVRPIATHNRRIKDYCSYRGLLVMSGVSGDGPHIIRSADGKAAVWCGALDDLWQFGKPRGVGGPWKDSAVTANNLSDPYLMTGYDKKTLTLSADKAVKVRVEVDITGTGQWQTWRTLEVAPGKATEQRFPEAFNAYWLRVAADCDCTATATLQYE
jgi:hypothetical protein